MANSENFIGASKGKPAPGQPPACPKCRSVDTSSAAKRPTPDSYWRCMKCGDVFSPALLSDASRRGMR